LFEPPRWPLVQSVKTIAIPERITRSVARMKILLTVNWVERAGAPAQACAVRSLGGRSGEMDWQHSEDQAIAYIEAGLFEYFVRESSRHLKVQVSRLPDGQKYLKVENGHETPLAQTSLPSPH
jgi:hypothetical protein